MNKITAAELLIAAKEGRATQGAYLLWGDGSTGVRPIEQFGRVILPDPKIEFKLWGWSQEECLALWAERELTTGSLLIHATAAEAEAACFSKEEQRAF